MQFLVNGGSGSSPSVCHVIFPETTVLPGHSEVQLPLSLSTTVLIAHSLTLTGDQNTLVRILNPSPGPVVIHQNEKVGKLLPLDQPDAVCTLDQLSLQQEQQKKLNPRMWNEPLHR